MKGAHTTVVHGETIDVEITAATFDPNKHMLLTGARNGTLKVCFQYFTTYTLYCTLIHFCRSGILTPEFACATCR